MDTELAKSIAIATSQRTNLPVNLDIQDLTSAYQLQHEVTALRSPEGAIGIKAGVTAKQGQAFFGLDHALIASLYADTMHASGANIPSVEGRLLESEVAIKVDKDGHPLEIAPALEIVAVRFADARQMTAPNLVACNLGADLFVVGDFIPWQDSFNSIELRLTCDGEVINEVSIADALGGPAPGAHWVVAEAMLRGFSLQDDFVFMMGACGRTVPAQVGTYRGEYGPLGSVELVIT